MNVVWEEVMEGEGGEGRGGRGEGREERWGRGGTCTNTFGLSGSQAQPVTHRYDRWVCHRPVSKA